MAVSVYKTQEEFGQFITLHFARQDIPDMQVNFGELTLTVLRAALLRVLQFLRDDPACKFTVLSDMTCLNYPEKQESLTVVYHLLSPLLHKRLRLKLMTEPDVSVASVASLFSNAVWYEREIREMFGVSFDRHPDLRRLLTDDSGVNAPLLKSFPSEGEFVLHYDEAKEECVYVKRQKKAVSHSFGIDLNQEES